MYLQCTEVPTVHAVCAAHQLQQMSLQCQFVTLAVSPLDPRSTQQSSHNTSHNARLCDANSFSAGPKIHSTIFTQHITQCPSVMLTVSLLDPRSTQQSSHNTSASQQLTLIEQNLYNVTKFDKYVHWKDQTTHIHVYNATGRPWP